MQGWPCAFRGEKGFIVGLLFVKVFGEAKTLDYFSIGPSDTLEPAGGLLEARKKKGLSQEEVAGKLNTKAPVIGRYERDEAKPSIEAAARLASLLEVSLDYLVGNAENEVDTATLNRVLELQKLPNEVRDKLYYFIDMSIRDYKAKQAYVA